MQTAKSLELLAETKTRVESAFRFTYLEFTFFWQITMVIEGDGLLKDNFSRGNKSVPFNMWFLLERWWMLEALWDFEKKPNWEPTEIVPFCRNFYSTLLDIG